MINFSKSVGKSLQTAQLQNLLRSRFVPLAVVQESELLRNDAIVFDGKNAPEMPRFLSRAFFREMIKEGFGRKRYSASAATEVISLLSERLSRLKTRKESGYQ